MKKSLTILWVIALMISLAVVGCKKDDVASVNPSDQPPTGVGANEESAMKYYAQNDEFVNNDVATFTDNTMAPTDYDETVSKTDAAVTPLRWGRFVNSVTRTVTVTTQPGDTIAIARVDRIISGVLKIRALSETGDTSTISKNFQDTSAKYVVFKRVANNPVRYWLNWLPVATSLVSGGTGPAPVSEAILITKLELTAGEKTVTVTDPLSTWLRYRWTYRYTGGKSDVPELTAGQLINVKVTVMSQSPDTDLVALRHGFNLMAGHFRRVKMTMTSQSGPDGNGFFTRTYEKEVPIRFYPGFFHFGIDAVTHATLFDDTAPYSVAWWGIPYRVY